MVSRYSSIYFLLSAGLLFFCAVQILARKDPGYSQGIAAGGKKGEPDIQSATIIVWLVIYLFM